MRNRYYFLAGLAVGYVMGAAAGRERYEQIRSTTQKIVGNPKVQQAATDLQHNAAHLVGSAKEKVTEKLADRDLGSWVPGRRNHGEMNGPGPVRADAKGEDPWADATKSHGPVH